MRTTHSDGLQGDSNDRLRPPGGDKLRDARVYDAAVVVETRCDCAGIDYGGAPSWGEDEFVITGSRDDRGRRPREKAERPENKAAFYRFRHATCAGRGM